MGERSVQRAWLLRGCDGQGLGSSLSTLLAFAFVLWMAAPASASPIQSFSQGLTTELSLGQDWLNFLAAGPTVWAKQSPPPFPSNLVLLTSNGEVIQTPFVEYLVWRRNLDPTRFDYYHPTWGPVLGQLVPPTTPIPGGGGSGGTTPPVNPSPEGGVPEPGMLPIVLTLSARRFGGTGAGPFGLLLESVIFSPK